MFIAKSHDELLASLLIYFIPKTLIKSHGRCRVGVTWELLQVTHRATLCRQGTIDWPPCDPLQHWPRQPPPPITTTTNNNKNIVSNSSTTLAYITSKVSNMILRCHWPVELMQCSRRHLCPKPSRGIKHGIYYHEHCVISFERKKNLIRIIGFFSLRDVIKNAWMLCVLLFLYLLICEKSKTYPFRI